MVSEMRLFIARWAKWSIPCVVAVAGCQRLGDEGPADDPAPADTDVDIDDSISGGSLLESGDEGGSDDGGVEVGCDPITNVPCGGGEKCTVVLSGSAPSFACVGETGSAEVDQNCDMSLEDGLDGCVQGTVCLGDEVGTCRPLCSSEADCTAAQCIEDPIHEVPHCASDCSPLEPTCPGLLQCRRQSDRYSCVDALPGDVGGAGEACELEGDAGCGEGLMCITGALVPGCAAPGCCVTLCDLDELDSCSAPATCTQALEAPAPGFETVGACFVPA